jgi:cob(I)alamin adenosyltransferase
MTSLAEDTRVSKSCARVEAYGTVDEANSAIGFARAAVDDGDLDDVLHFVQQRLFNCSSSLATPAEGASEKTPRISEADIAFLESAIDRYTELAGPLTHFVLEAGTEAASRLQLARAIMRRAERRVVALAEAEPIDAQVLAFVNRCSDLLFSAARYANAREGVSDEIWDPGMPTPDGSAES